MGDLLVTVVSASGLPGVDNNQTTSNPYCSVRIYDGPELKQQVGNRNATEILKKTLNPVWTRNQFKCFVRDFPNVVYFKVWAKHLFSSNALLGVHMIPISYFSLVTNQAVDMEVPLMEDTADKRQVRPAQGKLKVQICFVPGPIEQASLALLQLPGNPGFVYLKWSAVARIVNLQQFLERAQCKAVFLPTLIELFLDNLNHHNIPVQHLLALCPSGLVVAPLIGAPVAAPFIDLRIGGIRGEILNSLAGNNNQAQPPPQQAPPQQQPPPYLPQQGPPQQQQYPQQQLPPQQPYAPQPSHARVPPPQAPLPASQSRTNAAWDPFSSFVDDLSAALGGSSSSRASTTAAQPAQQPPAQAPVQQQPAVYPMQPVPPPAQSMQQAPPPQPVVPIVPNPPAPVSLVMSQPALDEQSFETLLASILKENYLSNRQTILSMASKDVYFTCEQVARLLTCFEDNVGKFQALQTCYQRIVDTSPSGKNAILQEFIGSEEELQEVVSILDNIGARVSPRSDMRNPQMLPMEDDAFNVFAVQIQTASVAAEKLNLVRATATQAYFTPAQIAQLLRCLDLSTDRMMALEVCLPRLVQTTVSGKTELVDCFTYSSDKEKVAEMLSHVDVVITPTPPSETPPQPQAPPVQQPQIALQPQAVQPPPVSVLDNPPPSSGPPEQPQPEPVVEVPVPSAEQVLEMLMPRQFFEERGLVLESFVFTALYQLPPNLTEQMVMNMKRWWIQNVFDTPIGGFRRTVNAFDVYLDAISPKPRLWVRKTQGFVELRSSREIVEVGNYWIEATGNAWGGIMMRMTWNAVMGIS